MKGLKNSRPFAAICLVAVIVLSVFGGGYRSVKKLEKKAYNAYYTDDAKYGDAEEDVKKLARYGSMLYTLCEACGCAEGELGSTVDAFDKAAGDPYLPAELYHSLFNLCTLSYNVLVNSSVSEQQKTSAKQYVYEMESTMRRLGNNGAYNDAAKKYNAAARSFPISLIVKNADLMIVFD